MVWRRRRGMSKCSTHCWRRKPGVSVTTPIRAAEPNVGTNGQVPNSAASAVDSGNGAVAKHVAVTLGALDSWDVLLVLGAGLLFAGLWLAVSLGIALTGIGALFIVGGLMGARGKQLSALAVEPNGSDVGA